MVKEIGKEEAKSYLSKAEEFLEEAKDALLKARFNVSGLNATQAIINANDALTVAIIGKRASRDHREAIRMHIEVIGLVNDSSGKKILKNALDSRTEVGYSGRMISKVTAESLLRNSIKFLEWVKKYVK